MELSNDKVFKIDVLPIKEFAAQSGGVSSSAVYYAIEHNLIDWIQIGDRKYIVLSKLTKQYKPNESPNRIKPKKKAKKAKRK